MAVKIIVNLRNVEKAILAFSGWSNAGNLTEHIFSEMNKHLKFQLVAEWDLDGYWSVQELRPYVKITHGRIRQLKWPQLRFYSEFADSGSPFIFATGREPSCSWHSFIDILTDQLQKWGCHSLLLLGSLYDQLFPDEIKVSAIVHDVSSFNLVHSWGCQLVDYEGPTAIHSAIMEAVPERGISCISLWTHLPFYIQGVHELALYRILSMISRFIERSLSFEYLLEAWEKHLRRIEGALERDPLLKNQIKAMEKARSSRHSIGAEGKVIHIENFLRNKDDRNEDEP